MHRRTFLLAAAGGRVAGLSRAATESRPPNIVFILTDDLGWGDLSCYGNQRLKTPNLDRLAAQGTLFTQFYVNGPVCSPSRAAFMTGHFPARHRIHGHLATPEENERRGMPNFLDPGVPTVASLLKKAGYRTGHFGKWHLGSGPGAPLPEAYGFDVAKAVDSNNPHWRGDKIASFRAHSTRLIVDETLQFIKQDLSRPFYVNVWTLLPHATLDPTKEQLEPFMKLSPQTASGHLGAHQIYFASLRDLDTQLGRLIDELDKLGLKENTLILFSSDNGPEDIHIRNASHSAFGSPGPFRGRKRSLYEGGIRVPFIARWPRRVPAGRVETRSVLSGVDLLPILLRIAGLPEDDALRLDGEDVSDILFGASRARRKPLFWEWRFAIAGYNINRSPMLAIREGDWKLLLNPDLSRVELYDVPRDLMELNNLADRRPEVVKDLAAKALAWQKTLPPGPIEPAAGRNDYPWPRD
jgi:N-acetylgalactosamine-6-sulfatase